MGLLLSKLEDLCHFGDPGRSVGYESAIPLQEALDMADRFRLVHLSTCLEKT
jgi:hypothetical protein